mmetsp:Transcript_3641/g.11230  ORF Transcript_3641/g.11230 Transcript_3641/m.11230 type:complete len:223 (+) Transcript_3641:188-856(+)
MRGTSLINGAAPEPGAFRRGRGVPFPPPLRQRGSAERARGGSGGHGPGFPGSEAGHIDHTGMKADHDAARLDFVAAVVSIWRLLGRRAAIAWSTFDVGGQGLNECLWSGRSWLQPSRGGYANHPARSGRAEAAMCGRDGLPIRTPDAAPKRSLRGALRIDRRSGLASLPSRADLTTLSSHTGASMPVFFQNLIELFSSSQTCPTIFSGLFCTHLACERVYAP